MLPIEMFGPDVNFTPARAVYPTADGGTSASAASAMTPMSTSAVTDPTTGQAAPIVSTGTTPVNFSGKSIYWWVGFLALLISMVFIARKAGGEEDFRNIRPTFYNFATITLTAVVGIVALKILAVKYRVPGASDIILAA